MKAQIFGKPQTPLGLGCRLIPSGNENDMQGIDGASLNQVLVGDPFQLEVQRLRASCSCGCRGFPGCGLPEVQTPTHLALLILGFDLFRFAFLADEQIEQVYFLGIMPTHRNGHVLGAKGVVLGGGFYPTLILGTLNPK